MLTISANDLKLYIENGDIITSGCVNTPMFSVKLSDEWSGFTVTAQFIGSGKTVHVSGIESETEYAIPWECIADSGRLTVSLMGVKGDTVKTAAPVTVTVTDSTITEGSQPEEPTPTAYEQYINTVNNIVEGAERSSNKVQSMLDSESSSEYPSVKAVREYVNTLSAVAASGSYNDLTDKPQKTSDFTNDGDGDTVTKYIGADQAYHQAFRYVSDNSFESITDEMGDGDIYGIPIPSAVVKYVKGKDELTEKSANKTDTISTESPSDTKYPSEKAVIDYVLEKTQGPAWHNIETIATTETLSVVTRAFGRANGDIVYPDYTKVNKIQVYLTIPPNADATATRIECRISDSHNTRIYMWDYISTTDIKVGWILIERRAKWIPTFTAAQTKPASIPNSTIMNTYTCSADNLELTGTENVRYLSFYGQLPAGTVIDIWGYYDED
jgi:hypothetical protein